MLCLCSVSLQQTHSQCIADVWLIHDYRQYTDESSSSRVCCNPWVRIRFMNHYQSNLGQKEPHVLQCDSKVNFFSYNSDFFLHNCEFISHKSDLNFFLKEFHCKFILTPPPPTSRNSSSELWLFIYLFQNLSLHLSIEFVLFLLFLWSLRLYLTMRILFFLCIFSLNLALFISFICFTLNSELFWILTFLFCKSSYVTIFTSSQFRCFLFWVYILQ